MVLRMRGVRVRSSEMSRNSTAERDRFSDMLCLLLHQFTSFARRHLTDHGQRDGHRDPCQTIVPLESDANSRAVDLDAVDHGESVSNLTQNRDP